MTTNKIVIKITTTLIGLIFGIDARFVTKTYQVLHRIRKANGIAYMYQYVKFCRLHITRYISGRPLMSITGSGVATVNGWPKCFVFLKPLLKGNKSKRALLTLLTLSKGIVPEGAKERSLIVPKFDSITDPYKGSLYVIPRFFIKVMFNKYRIEGKDVVKPSSKTMFLNMKSSPTGISVLTSINAALLHPPVEDHGPIQALMGKGYEIFKSAYDFASSHKEFFPLGISPGKLGIVHDAEGKERVIAMSDYWTQWALKPIHDYFLHILKTIPMDRTFTQDPFSDWKKDENRFWSLDLSSATDRFPLFVQKKVIKILLGDEIGEAWAHVLVNKDYSFEGKQYRYSVGQPMGAYSSWVVFAITHHFVVQWAAYRCGYKDFRDYILLGDDIVIKNDKVANRYMQLMEKWGVEISKHKTHTSMHTYEFAKRWIHHGKEISPLPVKGIMTHIGEPRSMLLLLLDWVLKTSFHLDVPVLHAVKQSYKGIRIKKQFHSMESLSRILDDYWVGLSYVKKIADPEQLRQFWIKRGWHEEKLPSSEEIYDFTHRLTNIALGTVIEKTCEKLETYVESFKGKFMKDYPIEELSFHPVFHSIRNILKNMDDRILELDADTGDPLKLMDLFIVPGVNEIIHLKRQIRREVTGIDRLWGTFKDPAWIEWIQDSLEWFDEDHNASLQQKARASIRRNLSPFNVLCFDKTKARKPRVVKPKV
jgi:hypothetical protein